LAQPTHLTVHHRYPDEHPQTPSLLVTHPSTSDMFPPSLHDALPIYEGFINPQQPPQVTPPPQTSARGQLGQPQDRTEARFEITDKTIDFLGFKTLQDLLGSLGRSSFGRHDTLHLSTGVESGGLARPYEF